MFDSMYYVVKGCPSPMEIVANFEYVVEENQPEEEEEEGN